MGAITKTETDGVNRFVYGKVTDGSIDTDEQIVDPAFARKALAEWYDTGGNVRQMHSTQIPPAGKGVLLEHKENDGEYVRTKVVDQNAIRLVDEGVYTGYSVGIARPRIERDMRARGGRIVGGKIVEISLVDRPALPTAKFAVLKAAGANGSLEYIGKVVVLDDMSDGATPTASGILPSIVRTVKRVRKGAHVTVHYRNEFGTLDAVEGRVINKGLAGISLDLSGYSAHGGSVLLADEDIEAIYKGSVPLDVITKTHVGIPDEAEFVRSIRNDSSRDIVKSLRRLHKWASSDTYPAGLDRADLEEMYGAYTAEMRDRESGFDPGPLGMSILGKGRIGNSPSLTKVLEVVQADLGKKDVDPAVGGGVDRDKMPAKDFAGRNRSYPIHSPGDVSDAASSIGRAGPDNYSADELRSRITSIARRKGPEFEAELPESWKDGENKSTDADLVKQGGYTHTHTHTGPDGITHKHPHTHAAGTPDHSELHEGGAHAHGHLEAPALEEDDSVTKKATTVDGVMCDKCKGTGLFEGSKCDKCGGSKVLKAAEPVVEKQVAQAHAAAADAHAAAAEAAAKDDDPKAAEDHADAADDHADEAEDAEDESEDAEANDAEDENPPDTKKAAKKNKLSRLKGFKVVEADGKFVLKHKGKVLGTHNTLEAAEAQKAAVAGEPKQPKVKKAAEIPWLIRRAHDATCSAYKVEDVDAAYPTIEKNGVAAALGPQTRTALMTMLKQEMEEDGGTGKYAEKISYLGKAIGCLQEFLDAESVGGAEVGDLLLAARADMNAAFKAANPTISDYPKPSETITAGQFSRPYISAGHQSESASAKAPRIPSTTHPIRATDFSRGPLTEGHQRYLSAKMAEFHDALSSWNPELCRMDANGYMAFDRQPDVSFERPPARNEIPNQDASAPKAITPASLAAVSKHIDIAPTTMVAKTYTPEELQAVVTTLVTDAVQPYQNEITKLKEEINKLESAPDPTRSAHRGVTGVGGLAKIAEATAKKAQQKAARKAKRNAKIAHYQDLANSPDPEMRIHAQARLARMHVDA